MKSFQSFLKESSDLLQVIQEKGIVIVEASWEMPEELDDKDIKQKNAEITKELNALLAKKPKALIFIGQPPYSPTLSDISSSRYKVHHDTDRDSENIVFYMDAHNWHLLEVLENYGITI